MTRKILFAMLLLFSFPLYAANTAWVTDKLYLGLYQKPDDKSKRLKLLKSGAKVTVLDRKGRYKKVRTRSGIVGWAKAHLLLSEPTAALKLPELKKQVQALQEEKSQLQNQLQKQEQLNKLKEQEWLDARQQLTTQLEQQQQQISRLTAQVEQLHQQAKEIKLPHNARIVVFDEKFYAIGGISLLGIMLFAYYMGRRAFERKIRSRLNGYKIW